MSNDSPDSILKLSNVGRKFRQGERTIEVLQDFSLALNSGESLGVVGPSGAGKSTMLQIAGLLEPPDTGRVFLGNRDTSDLNDYAKTTLRREYLGFVYQFHHLLPEFSAVENVILPQLVAGKSYKEAFDRGCHLLKSVGLQNRYEHRPGQLSGGEQQRVAIARSLVNKPKLLIADEPTGNLDIATGQKIIDILLEIMEMESVGAIIATHNPLVAERLSRTLLLT